VIPVEDYKVKEGPDGKVVENKKAGLVIPVPDGWSVETGLHVGEGGVLFLSPDAKHDSDVGVFLQEGCEAIAHMVQYKALDPDVGIYADYVRNEIADLQELEQGDLSEKQSLVKIDSYWGVRSTYGDISETPQEVSVEVPIKDKVFFIEAPLVLMEEGKRRACFEEFDRFLQTIEINK